MSAAFRASQHTSRQNPQPCSLEGISLKGIYKGSFQRIIKGSIVPLEFRVSGLLSGLGCSGFIGFGALGCRVDLGGLDMKF